VFAFDPQRKVKLVNRAAERLMALPGERLLGRTAEDLNLADCLRKTTPATLERTFPGGAGRWGVRRGQFREHGLPHELLVLSDLTRELREEELKAWQRLVRVLGHELNNSMAPIKSLSSSLSALLDREPPPPLMITVSACVGVGWAWATPPSASSASAGSARSSAEGGNSFVASR
jgi:nitrogen fixation/metabolism regulation signal transduction histidine kinase